jgi:acyl carrier protein
MNIREEIRQFVLESFILGDDGKALLDDSSFLENGIIDSTGILELVEFLESRYGIKVEDDELIPDNLDTIQNITKFLEKKSININA